MGTFFLTGNNSNLSFVEYNVSCLMDWDWIEEKICLWFDLVLRSVTGFGFGRKVDLHTTVVDHSHLQCITTSYVTV